MGTTGSVPADRPLEHAWAEAAKAIANAAVDKAADNVRDARVAYERRKSSSVGVALPVDTSNPYDTLLEKIDQYRKGFRSVRSWEEFKALNLRVTGHPYAKGDKALVGVACGYVAGAVVRKTIRTAVFCVGIGFGGFFLLRYYGVVPANFNANQYVDAANVARKQWLNNGGQPFISECFSIRLTHKLFHVFRFSFGKNHRCSKFCRQTM